MPSAGARAGGDTPLWDSLNAAARRAIAKARSKAPADGVVVVRTADRPARRRPRRFLLGLYSGLGVGVSRRSASSDGRGALGDEGLRAGGPLDGRRHRHAGRASGARRSCSRGRRRAIRREEDRRRRRPPAVPTPPPRVAEPLTILVAARDEEARIGETVAALRGAFPGRGGDRGRRRLARRHRRGRRGAGARVLRLPRRGKGQALTLVEREAPPGSLLLCDADLAGDLAPLAGRRRRPCDRRVRGATGRRLRDREARRRARSIRLR